MQKGTKTSECYIARVADDLTYMISLSAWSWWFGPASSILLNHMIVNVSRLFEVVLFIPSEFSWFYQVQDTKCWQLWWFLKLSLDGNWVLILWQILTKSLNIEMPSGLYLMERWLNTWTGQWWLPEPVSLWLWAASCQTQNVRRHVYFEILVIV